MIPDHTLLAVAGAAEAHRAGTKIVAVVVVFTTDVYPCSISKQKSLPLFVFLETIRHMRHFSIDNVFKETLCILE